MRHFIVLSTLLVLPSLALGKQPDGRKLFPAEIRAEDFWQPPHELHLRVPEPLRPVFLRDETPTLMRYRLNDATPRLWRILLDPQTPVR